jgi:NitT/TauT family transport system substrate-binding protein
MKAARTKAISIALVFALFAALSGGEARADAKQIRITRQPGLIYMPLIIMEQERLLEKSAAAKGLGDVEVKWLTFSSGGTSIDALLSGNVDLITGGASNMLLLFERSRGEVRGLSGAGGAPMLLVTRNPEVKKLADFSDKDKIAVPTVKISTQAVILQLAAEREMGEGRRNYLDPFTIQLGHPEAMAALMGRGYNEVNSHFSLPPYEQLEIKDPRIHVVLNSFDVVGGPLSNAVVSSTRTFYEANPHLVEAFISALDEANALIADAPSKAADIYLAATKDRITTEDLVAIMKEKGVVFSSTPYGVMLQAQHFYKTGVLKAEPKSWQQYFFPSVHRLPGS